MDQKACRKCGVTKPLGDFYVHRAMTDGHLNECKECVKARVKARYDAEPEKIKAYERERWELPERRAAVYASIRRARIADPERFAEYQRKTAARFPERKKARATVNNAIRDGRMKKPSTCSGCQQRIRIQAHHEDYAKPLEVIWLCTKCHGLHHRAA